MQLLILRMASRRNNKSCSPIDTLQSSLWRRDAIFGTWTSRKYFLHRETAFHATAIIPPPSMVGWAINNHQRRCVVLLVFTTRVSNRFYSTIKQEHNEIRIISDRDIGQATFKTKKNRRKIQKHLQKGRNISNTKENRSCCSALYRPTLFSPFRDFLVEFLLVIGAVMCAFLYRSFDIHTRRPEHRRNKLVASCKRKILLTTKSRVCGTFPS